MTCGFMPKLNSVNRNIDWVPLVVKLPTGGWWPSARWPIPRACSQALAGREQEGQ
jgi:hypothetical protein